MRTLDRAMKSDRIKFKVPRSVQDTIPVQRIWPDGIFQVGEKYSKMWAFSDVNYAVASKEDKTAMFLDYADFLNALDSGVSAKITVNNRRANQAEYARQLLSPPQHDAMDKYRKEFNHLVVDRISQANNGYTTERYITISVVRRNIDEARNYFTRINTEIVTHMGQLSSKVTELDAAARLEVLRDFYKSGQPAEFPFSFSRSMRRGHSFKDWIAPNTMEVKSGHFKMDGRYGRVLYLQDDASYIKDTLIAELRGISNQMMLSIDILPIPTDEAVREVQNRLLGVETNITNWQRRQNANNNFSATVPFDLEQQRSETKEMLEDLTSRDQRLMFCLVTVVLTADSLQKLDADTESVLSVARKHLCQMATLKYQQMDGLLTVLPYGLRQISALRTMTTESSSVLIPFHAQEIMQTGGLHYGQNMISKNIISIARWLLLNGNGFFLGVSGSGKSLTAKYEILQIVLRLLNGSGDDVLILDPESEYAPLVRALGGEVIKIAATSNVHINLMDMDRSYGENDRPLPEKTEFILSVFEQLMGAGNLTSQQKSVVGRCLSEAYADYISHGYTGTPPTLQDLYRILRAQPEPEAQQLALAAELITTGPLNVFAHQTNVNTKARLISYDIRELGDQLKPVGMLATLDAIYNRVIQNWRQGRRTWIYVDEFYLLLKSEFSSEFFFKLWMRLRKYNGLVSGITQNVEVILGNDKARMMLANSEFVVMLNQAATDRAELAKLLHISENQLGYITNSPAGSGLIKCGGSIVPFENPIPNDTQLYRLITTKPGEAMR